MDFSKIIDHFKQQKIPQNMLDRGQLVLNNFLDPIRILFEQKSVPDSAWTDDQIEFLLHTLSNMDTDKDSKAARVGEREARISSELHKIISGGFCHGVGRSGFLTAPQPKAPGGSIMYELSNYLARSILRKFGLPNIKKAIVSPIATGMSLALSLSALKPDRKNFKRNTVLIPRLDHKSILKAVDLMGFEKKIVEGKIFGDAVRIPFEEIEANYEESCFSILSFTSFFPPREHDDIKAISKFAQEQDLVHIVVNAYGVQSPEWMKLIRAGIDAGRIDAIIQSTDKNFLNPVGGAIIASPAKRKIEKISQSYAGRASASPIVNFLISMLSMGLEGYKELIEEQKKNRELLERLMSKTAEQINEKILNIFNPVAVGLTLKNVEKEKLTALGGALYNLRVTGPRVYDPREMDFGMCYNNYPVPYIVMNAAIGAEKRDIHEAVTRFEKAYDQIV